MPKPEAVGESQGAFLPSESDTPRSIRGPLRYQISTSSPQLEAGTKFSIYTRITNPYDVPVTITSVTTLLPVEFVDVAVLERARRKQKINQLIKTAQEARAGKQSRNVLTALLGKLHTTTV
jgi:hypothetical protein